LRAKSWFKYILRKVYQDIISKARMFLEFESEESVQAEGLISSCELRRKEAGEIDCYMSHRELVGETKRGPKKESLRSVNTVPMVHDFTKDPECVEHEQFDRKFYKICHKLSPLRIHRTSAAAAAANNVRSHRRPSFRLKSSKILSVISIFLSISHSHEAVQEQVYDSNSTSAEQVSQTEPQQVSTSCFGGLQTFEKISMSTFENPSPTSSSSNSFGSGILIQQDDQALTSECVNLCRSQSSCLSFVIDYNKFECKSYATTQQELQRELDARYQAARSVQDAINNVSELNGGYRASASTENFQQLLPAASSNYFEKICLDGIANRDQFNDVCGQGRLWTIERVVDSFLDGYVEKEVTNVNNKDECSKLCIFETRFVCRSADYDQHTRLCRLSKEDRRTQPQAMRYIAGSNRQYLENQCATAGPSSCIYETKKNVGIISMDALKFAQTVQDCQMKCNQETTFNCRSYSFHQQRCFLSGDDSSSLNSNLIKLPEKQGWLFGEKRCIVEQCTKGVFSYEKITGYVLRSALSTPIDLMMPSNSFLTMTMVGNNLDELEKLQHESSQTRLSSLLPVFQTRSNRSSDLVTTMMRMAANSSPPDLAEQLHESASTDQRHKTASNLAITSHCRNSCDLSYLNCPAFTIDYKNNRCQRLDRNSQGRHSELVARDGFAYYEKICLRVPEIMSMCQDKYWIFERVIGHELAPRLYEKSLKFVQSRRDCEEYCLGEKQFQCRSALYNDEVSECKLSQYDRRLASQEGSYYKNFNVRVSYLENQCIRDHSIEKSLQCYYEQAKDEPSYPTYTEMVEMVPVPTQTSVETEYPSQHGPSVNRSNRYGASYCEQICNDNERFECHSFGYYSSTAQCFISGDDSISAGEAATTRSTGFTYFEKKCRSGASSGSTNSSSNQEQSIASTPSLPTSNSNLQSLNPYFQPNRHDIQPNHTPTDDKYPSHNSRPANNGEVGMEQQFDLSGIPKLRPSLSGDTGTSADPDNYKCGHAHTFVYQRISGFEPIGGYLTLLVRSSERPGIVEECSKLCKRALECRAFVVDYNSNHCFAMLENSSVGLLNLRQTLGRDYFEGFCVADHILASGFNCRNKTWVMDKIVDQAVIGVQHHKVLMDSDRAQCRQACLEERLFKCKSAMFDGATGDCKLYSVDRESMPQMHLIFTKGVDFFENQCQIMSSSCPYDAIERDMTIVTVTKSTQARSAFECEHACDSETNFNCRSYTYHDQNPSLPNLCSLSSDSRSTSQRGSVRELQRTLYAERNCFYRRPRYPGSLDRINDPLSSHAPAPAPASLNQGDPYQLPAGLRPQHGHSSPINKNYAEDIGPSNPIAEGNPALGCAPHQFTFERSFGYDFRSAQKERAAISPTIGIAISCQQECLRRGDRCQSFVVDYALPYQSCFLIESLVGANKKLLFKSPNSAYFEKICLPRTGIEAELLTHAPILGGSPIDLQSMDVAPSYSHEPWSLQVNKPLPYYLQQQQLVENYPSRTCAKLWSFERFINYNFTAPSDKTMEDIQTKTHCEALCLNEANFSCRAATYDYTTRVCRLYKNTRRTIMSQFVDLESGTSSSTISQVISNVSSSQMTSAVQPSVDEIASAQSVTGSNTDSSRTPMNARQYSGIPEVMSRNVDYFENTCTPEPSSCQYRQLYDLFSAYIDKVNHAVSLSDCQRQCDLERLFSCKSINYDPSTRNCMLVNEDLISLGRSQQASLLPKKNNIYSEKGNCEMISVQCNSQEMLVSINFESPFRGRVMARGNPEQCFLLGDGQTSIKFPVVFGPKCNSRQEGHNTFVNEVVIQQHPVIMTDNDKVVRVMCAFEAPDQTITLKNPSSRDNKTGIDVGTPESSRTRHDKHQFSSVVSNKAQPPSVLLRILDQSGRDASMINLGDDLTLKIQMQTDGQNSALGIFARNLAARSSNGETLLLIDQEGCPVDHQVFPALEIDPKDGKSLYSTFKAFRFPSSGLVNFEVQIRFCPERCQPIDCLKEKKRSYGRKKRALLQTDLSQMRTSLVSGSGSFQERSTLDSLSTVMKPGKAFQYLRELLHGPQINDTEPPLVSDTQKKDETSHTVSDEQQTRERVAGLPANDSNDSTTSSSSELSEQEPQPPSDVIPLDQNATNEFELNDQRFNAATDTPYQQNAPPQVNSDSQSIFQKSILFHVDERVVPSHNFAHSRGLNLPQSQAPYGRFSESTVDVGRSFSNKQRSPSSSNSNSPILKQVEHTTTTLDSTTNSEASDAISSSRIHETREVQATKPGIELPLQHNNDFQDTLGQEQSSSRDTPLRFSILVGENQPATEKWSPSLPAPVMTTNSTSVDLDHIVIAGKNGNLGLSPTVGTRTSSRTNFITTQDPATSSAPSDVETLRDIKFSAQLDNATSKNVTLEQTFDALPSNSVTEEVRINQIMPTKTDTSVSTRSSQTGPLSEPAASRNCQIDSGSSRLWTIIWTGSFVIALNMCLVVLSLVLYFKRVHLSKDHSIMRATSDCGTHSSNGRGRWPSVLLKSKQNLGTSLNAHEHFFCKLNSKPNGSGAGLSGHDFNWPNFSSNSSHSTISSMASPLPVTSIRINQSMRPNKPALDSKFSLRGSSDSERNNSNISTYNLSDNNQHENYM